MAGLGVNSGIMDSLILANNIIKNIRAGHDIGDMMALAQFESEAKVQSYANSLALEGIKQAFEIDCFIGNSIRSLGLGMLQNN